MSEECPGEMGRSDSEPIITEGTTKPCPTAVLEGTWEPLTC